MDREDHRGNLSRQHAAEVDPFIPTRSSLLSRLRNLGDNASWQDFFDTYWKLIYNAAVKAGLSDAEAQDVVQETVITVSRKIQEFKYDPARGSFKGWLLHTTRWRILDHLRKQKPETAPSSALDDSRRTDVLERVPDPASAQIDAVWEAEWQQNLLDAAMQRIKSRVRPKHYQVFELCALKQLPARKVAVTLCVSVPQVHLINHRIRNLIRKEVKHLEESGL